MTVENCRYIFIKLVCESCRCGSSKLNRSVCAVKLLTCFGVTPAPNVNRETSFAALLRSWRRKTGLWCDLISDATRLESRWKPMEADGSRPLDWGFLRFSSFPSKTQRQQTGERPTALCSCPHIECDFPWEALYLLPHFLPTNSEVELKMASSPYHPSPVRPR